MCIDELSQKFVAGWFAVGIATCSSMGTVPVDAYV